MERVVIEIEGWLELDCPDKAIEKIKPLLANPAARAVGLVLRVRASVSLNKFRDALTDIERARELDHDEEWADLTEAWCRKRLHDLAGAVTCMQRLIDRGQSPIGHFNLACYLALMGDRQRALDELSIACGMDVRFRSLLEEEQDLESLRQDPAFQALMLRKS